MYESHSDDLAVTGVLIGGRRVTSRSNISIFNEHDCESGISLGYGGILSTHTFFEAFQHGGPNRS
jgi:hypothetical protein